jgi:hypothetical protein
MQWMVLFLLAVSTCATPSSTQVAAGGDSGRNEKINGISLAAAPHPLRQEDFDELKKTQAGYVCLLPFAFVRHHEPVVYYNSPRQWWGERPEGILAGIRQAKAAGLKVMIKPQLWMHNRFTGDLAFQSESDWKKFEQSYSDFLFQLLPLADSLGVEVFCLGTELDSFIHYRPHYWGWLIDTIRSVYSGKLTYAENWDAYARVPFWEKLNYIGINAYFPLSDEKTPSGATLSNAWKKHCAAMQTLSEKTGRPVLFTEFGYRSIDYCAREPWQSYHPGETNNEAQLNAFEALFRECWHQPWFAGGFCWKWFDKLSRPDVSAETDYTPQGKPAEALIREWYSGTRN